MDLLKMTIADLKQYCENARKILDKDFERRDVHLALENASKELSRRERETFPDRRPNINYFDCGLSVGQKIQFSIDTAVEISVYNGRELLWDGHIIHYTPLKNKLHKMYEFPLNGKGIFRVDGKDLDEIYDETYGPKKP
jgi:hypothetical protein